MNGKYVLTVPKLASSLVRSEDHLSPISPYRSLSIAPLTESLQRETSNLNKSNDDELITLLRTPVSGFIRPYLFRSASFSLLFSPIRRYRTDVTRYRSLSANSTRREKKKQALKQDLIFFFSPQDSNSFILVHNIYIFFPFPPVALSPRTIPLLSLSRSSSVEVERFEAPQKEEEAVAAVWLWLKRDEARRPGENEATKGKKGELPSYAFNRIRTPSILLFLSPFRIEFILFPESIVFSQTSIPFSIVRVVNECPKQKRRGKVSFIAPRYFAAWSSPFVPPKIFVRHSTRRRRSTIHV